MEKISLPSAANTNTNTNTNANKNKNTNTNTNEAALRQKTMHRNGWYAALKRVSHNVDERAACERQ